MMGGRSWDDWIARYETGHRNPINRICHTIGIPMIVASLAIAAFSLGFTFLWPVAAVLFVGGWALQFLGHLFEGRRPEFFSDWRFLLVGLRWWLAKVGGRI
jgi:uncharacterized membrane protein YGL010W